VDKPGNNNNTTNIVIFEVVSLIRINFSLFVLDVHTRASTDALNITAMARTGNVMWITKRSKNRTFTLQLVLAKIVRRFKLKMPNGKAISRNMVGHGTLSNTLGMLEKIWIKDNKIFAWPMNLLARLNLVSLTLVLVVSALVDVLHNRKNSTKQKRTAHAMATGIVAIKNDAPPLHGTHSPPTWT